VDKIMDVYLTLIGLILFSFFLARICGLSFVIRLSNVFSSMF